MFYDIRINFIICLKDKLLINCNDSYKVSSNIV